MLSLNSPIRYLMQKSQRVKFFMGNKLARINKSPIFVLGNPKSGTSAISHLLADFGGLSKTIDIPPIWTSSGCGVEIIQGRCQFSSVVQGYKLYFSRKLIKDPNLIFFIEKVMDAFPEARYVFVIRDPRDNIRSSLNRRGVAGNFKNLEERFYPKNEKDRKIIKSIVDPNIWGGKRENYVGVLAHKWNMATDNFMRHQDRILLAKYEDFLVDKCSYIARLAQQLDIPKMNDIADKVNIQYQPRGKDRSVPWKDFFGHENLKRIENICGENMKKFGYTVGC